MVSAFGGLQFDLFLCSQGLADGLTGQNHAALCGVKLCKDPSSSLLESLNRDANFPKLSEPPPNGLLRNHSFPSEEHLRSLTTQDVCHPGSADVPPYGPHDAAGAGKQFPCASLFNRTRTDPHVDRRRSNLVCKAMHRRKPPTTSLAAWLAWN